MRYTCTNVAVAHHPKTTTVHPRSGGKYTSARPAVISDSHTRGGIHGEVSQSCETENRDVMASAALSGKHSEIPITFPLKQLCH